jgi:hypothetical protein
MNDVIFHAPFCTLFCTTVGVRSSGLSLLQEPRVKRADKLNSMENK